MDIATIVGLILGVASVVGSILAGGTMAAFIDVASVVVVGGGVTAATFIKWPLAQIKNIATCVYESHF